MTLSRPPTMIFSFGVEALAASAEVSLAEPHAARVVPSARTAAAVCRTRVDFTGCAPSIWTCGNERRTAGVRRGSDAGAGGRRVGSPGQEAGLDPREDHLG